MAGTAVLGRLTWLAATVAAAREETPRVRTLELDVEGWAAHRAGQHLDVRLTAEDGYQAQRSYSIASAPGDPLAITIERLEEGEVSPYLVDDVQDGDVFEVRGPIGGYFVWDGDEPGPVLLVAGGSGVVPLMAMARHRARVGAEAPMRLVYSSRTWEDVIYRDELETLGIDVVHTLTRSQPQGWNGYSRRIDDELLREVAFPAAEEPRVYVCGSTRFVDAAADGLVRLGYDPRWIRTERFGATG
ncbi:MAG TPA: ferredoxin reductase [Gaiellaceae bacterium]|nr:ferredoxin reductase [Gaiellaceae bacterium]